MNPNYKYTITIYHKKDGAWIKSMLHDCFWKEKIVGIQNGKEAGSVNVYVVRIPSKVVDINFAVAKDDIIVLGVCPDEITDKSPNTATQVLGRNKPNSFRVTAISDNTKNLFAPHYHLEG